MGEIEKIAGGVPEDPNAPISDYNPLDQWEERWGNTVASVINYAISIGEDPKVNLQNAIQTHLDTVSKAARESPDWTSDFFDEIDVDTDDPLVATHVDLDSKYALVSGMGYEDVRIDFGLGDELWEWINIGLADAFSSL